jgi:hypothetical protein
VATDLRDGNTMLTVRIEVTADLQAIAKVIVLLVLLLT